MKQSLLVLSLLAISLRGVAQPTPGEDSAAESDAENGAADGQEDRSVDEPAEQEPGDSAATSSDEVGTPSEPETSPDEATQEAPAEEDSSEEDVATPELVTSEEGGPSAEEPAPETGETGETGDTSEANAADVSEAVASEDEAEEESTEPAETPEATVDSGVRGRVLDSATGQGVPQAPVFAQSESGTETAIADEDGSFELRLPAGRYTLRSYYDLYHGARIAGVRVRRGRWLSRDLVLDPIDEETDVAVDEVEVTYRADASGEAATQALQREAAGMQDMTSAEALSESGASNASDGARQIAGVLVDGDQPIIRGLQGQYVAVLLNGTPVPSVDPDSPGVDLDLFPTSFIQNLAVLKTLTADMPAAWAGGIVDVRTVQFPSEFTLEIGLDLGGNHLSTFQDQLEYQGGSLDALGFDNARALPDAIPNERLQLTRGGDRTGDDLDVLGREFSNVWQYQRETALPNFGLSATLGNAHTLGEGRKFGYLMTVGYDNTQRREVGVNRSRPTLSSDGSLRVFNDMEAERGVDEVTLTALGTASWDITQNSSISLLSLYNRSTSDEVERLLGTNAELAAGELTERWQFRYIARSLFFTQLRGDHRQLGPNDELRLQWTAFVGTGTRDEPDRRTIIYGPQGGAFRWLEKASSGERFYSGLNQLDYGVDANLRFPLWSLPAGEASATVGGGVRRMERSLLNRRFRMLQEQPPPPDQSVYAAGPEELFSDGSIGTLTRLREFTGVTDSYEAAQTLYSAFVNVESPIVGRLSAVAGARLEIFDQSVSSFDPFDLEGEQVGTDRVDVDVMPALSLKQGLNDDMNLRLAYSSTVVRPQIRQLAPYQYYDFQRDRNMVGNPELRRMRGHHLDLRWEWFLSGSERLTASVYYKALNGYIYPQIRNPSSYATQVINADDGWIVGGEIEAAISLGRIHEALSDFSFYGNFSLAGSLLNLPEELSGAVADQIRIPGQAPYVLNLSLRYDNDVAGVSGALVYNVVGPRITDVGVLAGGTLLPNIERAPFHSLDLVLRYEPIEELQFSLKFRNILNQTQRFTMSDFVESEVSPGTSFQLGVQVSY